MSDPDIGGSEPLFECDLIMKGGVTSGIIYPAAIGAIARTYRIRSIGGTSAGAIAAAGAAAMEFGRRSKRNAGSITTLSGLAAKLGEPVDGQPMLLRLFQPDKPTKRFFDFIFRIASSASKVSAIFSEVVLPCAVFSLVMAVLAGGATSYWLRTALPSAGFLIALGIALVLLLFLASTIAYAGFIAWSGLKAMAANGYGLCSGNAQYLRLSRKRFLLFGKRKEIRTPSLTGWLHAQYQELAGLDTRQVMTFGDLWVASRFGPGVKREDALAAARAAADLPPPEPGKAPRHDEVPRDIELSLVASDINRAQSVQLPFMRREDRLFVRISDLKALFPKEIVDWMIARQRTDDGRADLLDLLVGAPDRADFIGLPLPEDLPVLFAVRMSLSFPFLFRAVRLYIVRRREDGRNVLKELLLADGGLTSNFPVHLFDEPVPTRPTFCINLLYHDDQLLPDGDTGRPMPGRDVAPETGSPEPAQTGKAGADAAQAETTEARFGTRVSPTVRDEDLVYMLRSNRGRLSAYTEFDEASPIARLGRYAMRLVTTARQWSDNQLIDVPGYRDRIVHIKMLPGEGGFNLAMGKETIARLEKRGARAGDVIARRFHPATIEDPLYPGEQLQLNWANHRFVRFRSFLAGVEVAAVRFQSGWEKDKERGERASSDPTQAAPSLEAICEAASGASSAFPSYVGYAFKSKVPADLALDMVEAFKSLTIVPDPAANGIDYVNFKGTSPRPKGLLRLRPPLDTDTLVERP